PRPRPAPPVGAGFMPADGVSAVVAVQPAFAGRDKPGPTDSSQPPGPAPAPRPPRGAGVMPADGVSAVAAGPPPLRRPGYARPHRFFPATRTRARAPHPQRGRLYAGRRRVGGRRGPTPPSPAGINPAPQILPSHQDPRPRPAPPCGAGFMPADGVSAVAAVQPA